MLLDDLKEQLKRGSKELNVIKKYWEETEKEKHFQEIKEKSLEHNLTWDSTSTGGLLKNLQKITSERTQYQHLLQQEKDFSELIIMFASDDQELEKLKNDIRLYEKEIHTLKLELLLDEELDNQNCFLTITPGAGGTESQDWAEILLRMYIRFCEQEHFNFSIMDYQSGDTAGIKSATLFIKGNNAYGLLKSEHGVHRLVRISPFDANKRRHTSFTSIFVVPEAPDIKINIDPKDLRIDTYRAGGAGGQHVNKTDSAVRITHIPTNIVVQCQSERSQLQNKETAMKLLKAKLLKKEQDELNEKRDSLERKKIEWGSQIRSTILNPYQLVKDHRTYCESSQPELVLDGFIMPFIEAYLVYKKTLKSAEH